VEVQVLSTAPYSSLYFSPEILDDGRIAPKYRLHCASDRCNVSKVVGKPKVERRSGCPVSISLEMLGDRWSLLIIRDLMVRGYRTFKDFQGSSEGIATNILADRLRKLEAAGIITAEPEKEDGRRVNYRLTEKGIDLAPVLLELLIWGARHEETGAPCALIENMEKHREEVLVEVRRRWRERDLTPLLPQFKNNSRRKEIR
jgi:DNA-binding HxlR family transcriptional regulator